MSDRPLFQIGDSPCCAKVRMAPEHNGFCWKKRIIESGGYAVTEYLEEADPDRVLRPEPANLRARMQGFGKPVADDRDMVR